MKNQSTVLALFDAVAAAAPDHIAVYEEGKTITYAQLSNLSKRVAGQLKEQQSAQSEVVGVMLPSGYQLIACMLGCFRAGMIYMPIDSTYPDSKLAYMVDKAKASCLIGHPSKLEEKFGKSSDQPFRLVDIKAILSEDNNHEPSVDDHVISESAYVFYTSGSTGKSKAVVGRHESLRNFITWQIDHFKLAAGHHIAQYAPVTFDASLKDILAAICSGATVCIVPLSIRHNIGKLIRWMGDVGITHFHCVPSVFRLLYGGLENEPDLAVNLRSLQTILLAGEKLYQRDVTAWNQIMKGKVQLYNLYGATEATILSTVHKIEGSGENSLKETVPVGKPIQMCRLAIIKQGRICRPGEIGEIYIKSPFLTAGYLDDKALNQEAFVQNPLNKEAEDIIYRTGDYGKYYVDGSIEVIGRQDGMLKINGVRVESGEIIAAVMQISGVQHVEVMPLQTTDGETKIACYYTGEALPDDQLREELGRSLLQPAIPSYFVHLNEFPKNLNGKVDRKALPDPRKANENEGKDDLTGRVEQRLGSIWKEVLQVSSISRDASFFELGGQSIKAIRLISLIYREFNVDVSLKQLFEARCIRQLALEIAPASVMQNNSGHDQGHLVSNSSPLSNGQMRIWMMNQMIGASAFNVSLDFQVVGDLRIDALRKAFYGTLLRQPILRVLFRQEEEGVRQKVVAAKDLKTPFVYAVNSDVSQVVTSHHNRAFNLEREIPVRLLVVKNGDNEHYLSLVVHHIVTDGWSMSILVNQMIDLYNQALEDPDDPSLIEVPCPYFNYVQKQNDYLASQKASSDQKYWIQQLRGYGENVSFPTDFKRQSRKTFSGKQQEFLLDKKYKEGIATYCKQHDCSEFMILLALVNFILYKFTGSSDIALGTTIADRPDVQDQESLGFYVNTLAVRHQLNANETLDQLVKSVKERFLQDQTRNRFPFEKVVSLHDAGTPPNRSPIFDVLVEVLDTDDVVGEAMTMKGLQSRRVEQPASVAQYDVAIRWILENDSIRSIIEYNTDLFSSQTIVSIYDSLKVAIDELLSGAVTSLDSISLLQIQHAQKMDSFTDTF